MKTSSRIFIGFFILLGFIAAIGALHGAKHQWFIAGICALVSLAFWDDLTAKSKS